MLTLREEFALVAVALLARGSTYILIWFGGRCLKRKRIISGGQPEHLNTNICLNLPSNLLCKPANHNDIHCTGYGQWYSELSR